MQMRTLHEQAHPDKAPAGFLVVRAGALLRQHNERRLVNARYLRANEAQAVLFMHKERVSPSPRPDAYLFCCFKPHKT
jgi:hypothetical protein